MLHSFIKLPIHTIICTVITCVYRLLAVCPVIYHLCGACVGVHLFISIAGVINAVLGLLNKVTEEVHFHLIFPVAYLASILLHTEGNDQPREAQ